MCYKRAFGIVLIAGFVFTAAGAEATIQQLAVKEKRTLLAIGEKS